MEPTNTLPFTDEPSLADASEVGFRDYVRVCLKALDTAARLVRDDETFQAAAKALAGSGRGGSIAFEEEVALPALVAVGDRLSEELRGTSLTGPNGRSWVLEWAEFHDPSAGEELEAGRRSAWDAGLVIWLKSTEGTEDRRLFAPVNVKYVRNDRTASNTCSASSFAWVMFGEYRRREVLSLVAETKKSRLDSLVLSDYFFLAFEKGDDPRSPVGAAWSSSVLSITPGSSPLHYNPAQNFPYLQVNYPSAAALAAQAARTTELPATIAKARRRLRTWLFEQHLAHLEAVIEAWV
jgi:hypothetical protein